MDGEEENSAAEDETEKDEENGSSTPFLSTIILRLFLLVLLLLLLCAALLFLFFLLEGGVGSIIPAGAKDDTAGTTGETRETTMNRARTAREQLHTNSITGSRRRRCCRCRCRRLKLESILIDVDVCGFRFFSLQPFPLFAWLQFVVVVVVSSSYVPSSLSLLLLLLSCCLVLGCLWCEILTVACDVRLLALVKCSDIHLGEIFGHIKFTKLRN